MPSFDLQSPTPSRTRIDIPVPKIRIRRASPVLAPSTTADLTEPESTTHPGTMASKAPRVRSASPPSKTISLSPPPKRTKTSPKDVDWSGVTDPEERRRIQNRIAQRKFREKAREQKERAEREARNQEQAGNCYRIPLATDLEPSETEPSGLPWGGVNLNHVLARGHEAESRRSSGRGTYIGENSRGSSHYSSSISYKTGLHQTASYDSSGAEDGCFDDTPYLFGASIIGQAYPTIP